MTVVDDSK